MATALMGCDRNDLFWAQFNAEGDQLEILVGAPVGPPVTADLHSSTRQHVIGQAVVDPGSGPVGTLHRLVVRVGDEFDPDLQDGGAETIVERVGRVSVDVNSGRLGVERFDLRQDSAARQTWVLELESLGDPGAEPRTDVFTILLWEAVTRAEAEALEGRVRTEEGGEE